MGFSITSPDLESLADRMDDSDPITAYHRAAASVGADFEGRLAAAYREADAHDELIDTIGTYIHPDGTAYVGIPASSPHNALAHELEYGTPLIPPAAPIRTSVLAHGEEMKAQMTSALDQEMGAELLRRREIGVEDYREGGD